MPEAPENISNRTSIAGPGDRPAAGHTGMKQLAMAGCLILLLAQGCSKKFIPACIGKEVAELKSDSTLHVARVDEYLFQGRKVYVFQDDPRVIADGGARVLDSACRSICFLGGIAALTSCNGVKFYDVAVHKRNLFTR